MLGSLSAVVKDGLGVALLAGLAIAGAFALAGCDNDDPPICAGYNDAIADISLRNPETGQCESFGGYGGGGDCGCSPCPRGDFAEPIPTWGTCYSICEGMTEGDCQQTAGCRAAYMDACPANADCLELDLEYVGCWAVDTRGPQAGACEELDAESCSTRDDCSVAHQNACPGDADPSCYGSFLTCLPEGEPEVGPAGLCYADVTCVDDAPDCPAGTHVPGIGEDGCWTDYCIPVGECETPTTSCEELQTLYACVQRPDCEALFVGTTCTCNGDDCTCSQEFDSCRTATP